MARDPVRFIIITVPPAEVAEQIDRFRRAIAEVGDTWEALTYPPHITLRTGALVPPEHAEQYADRLVQHLAQVRSFPVETGALQQTTYRSNGELRHFVGYEIDLSDSLMSLHRRLLEQRRWIKGEQPAFRPHLSVAYHDLDAKGALRIQRWIDTNRQRVPAGFSWTCDNVALYTRGATDWEPYRIVRL